MRLPLPKGAETNETIAEISLKSSTSYPGALTWLAPIRAEAIMRKLLALLVVLTIGCGIASGLTIAEVPAHMDIAMSEPGY
jgi:hypothetical protein